MASSNISEKFNCSVSGEIYFCGIFESRPSKFAAVVLSCFLLSINIFIWYGAIWFERFGSDQGPILQIFFNCNLCFGH